LLAARHGNERLQKPLQKRLQKTAAKNGCKKRL